MLCSENPSGSKGCCHRMCCFCKAKDLFLPLFAWLCLSRNGIEVAESEPAQSRCGNESARCMATSCKFSSLFSRFCCYTHYQGVKEDTSKTENTFGFLFKQMIVIPFLSYWITIQDTFRHFCAPYNKTDSIGVESKIMLFKGNAKKKEIKYSFPSRISFYCKWF